MRYEDIALEAVTEHEVGLTEGLRGTIRWYAPGVGVSTGPASAWMSHSTGRTWIAHNDKGASFRGTKAQAANWCLDQAANGTTR